MGEDFFRATYAHKWVVRDSNLDPVIKNELGKLSSPQHH
jgi:hypothetical protein